MTHGDVGQTLPWEPHQRDSRSMGLSPWPVSESQLLARVGLLADCLEENKLSSELGPDSGS